jgi:hypothetical protein
MNLIDDVDGMGDRNEFLQHLIDADELTDKQLGIAKIVIAKGEGALKGYQPGVLQSILDDYAPDQCERHGYTLPWGEKYEFYRTGRCCYCERDDERHAEE